MSGITLLRKMPRTPILLALSPGDTRVSLGIAVLRELLTPVRTYTFSLSQATRVLSEDQRFWTFNSLWTDTTVRCMG